MCSYVKYRNTQTHKKTDTESIILKGKQNSYFYRLFSRPQYIYNVDTKNHHNLFLRAK